MKLFKKIKDFRIGFEDLIMYMIYGILILTGLGIFGIGVLVGRFLWK